MREVAWHVWDAWDAWAGIGDVLPAASARQPIRKGYLCPPPPSTVPYTITTPAHHRWSPLPLLLLLLLLLFFLLLGSPRPNLTHPVAKEVAEACVPYVSQGSQSKGGKGGGRGKGNASGRCAKR